MNKKVKTHTPINRATLNAYGWNSDGWYNNREFFSKGDITIIEHNGEYGLPDHKGALYSTVTFNTIEELEQSVYDCYVKYLSVLNDKLKKTKENLRIFNNYE